MPPAAESRPPRRTDAGPGMSPHFDELRATQAAAILLKHAGGRCNYTVLLKILYLADRESLAEVGAPIAGASFANLRNGPLASDVYDCVKAEAACPVWREYVRTDGYDVVLLRDAGDSELSDFDVATLKRLFARFGSKGYREMIDVVHELPEWKDPGDSSSPLPPEEIMRAAGVEEAAIEGTAERNAHVPAVNSLLR